MGKRWVSWKPSELNLIREAVVKIEEGSSLYEEGKRLKKSELSYRTAGSIKAQIYLQRRRKI